MWASAQAADTQTAWQQVNAWRRTHDLLLHHAGRLKACADELSYAWPPGKSPAAQAFIEHITQLRTAILQASVDAATNYSAIAGVLTSLSAARSDMAKLMEEWESYENSGTGEQARRSLSGGPDSPEALNARARSRMSQNDQEVLEASRRLVDLTSSANQEAWKPMPLDDGSRGFGSSSGSRSPTDGIPQTSSLTPPTIAPIGAIDSQVDLAESSAPPRPVGPPVPSLESMPASPVPSAGVGTVGLFPAPRMSSAGDVGRIAQPNGRHPGQVNVGSGAASFPPSTSSGGQGTGKVNPVGGVIEPNRAAAPASAFPLMGGARTAAEGHRDSVSAATLHWEVPTGVCPVIEPVPEQPIELGPGVIGIDR